MNTLQEIVLHQLEFALKSAVTAGLEIIDDSNPEYKLVRFKWDNKLRKVVTVFDEIEKSEEEKYQSELEDRADMLYEMKMERELFENV